VGADYVPVSGMRNYDDVVAHFGSLQPLGAGSVRVTARVFYQSTMRELVEELARANSTDDRGTNLVAIWEQTGRAAPRLIASATADVAVGAGVVEPGAGDGGIDGGVDGGPAPGGGSGCGCTFVEPIGAPIALALLSVIVARARRRR